MGGFRVFVVQEVLFRIVGLFSMYILKELYYII